MERTVRQSNIYPIVLIWIFFLASCKPHVDPVEPKLTTTTPGNITSNAAASGGNISDDGGASVTVRGVCWNTSSGPTITNSKTTDGTGTGSFTSSISGLNPGTTYYAKAYATNSAGTGYGNEVSFKTLAIAPALTTSAATAIASSTAVSGGNITSDGGGTVSAKGVCWSTNQNPTIADAKTTDGSGTGSFSSSLAGLNPGTTYYIRAYATNPAGTGYGNEVSFKTLSVAPTLTTNAITLITAATATSGGNITADGGATVTARGVCWSTTQSPTTASSKTTDGTGSGNFTSSIAGLNPGTIYYVRAYATNSTGTGYGNEVSFTTLAKVPTLTTSAVSAITTTTAASGGNITSDGGGTVTARGVCWSTTQNPTTANSRSSDGNGTGNYTSLIAGLTAATTYYVRAYATNSAGTGYGDQLSFVTSKVLTQATLTTANASNITTTSATVGGNVTGDGNATVTERGIVYGTAQNPTTSDTKVAVGNGTGNFTTNLTGLTSGTTYYVKSYAINSQGTAYGNQITFKTTATVIASLATLTTAPATAITLTGATLSGSVTNDGNATVTERGFVYGIVQNPTISNNKVAVGNGTGTFTTTITGLAAGTTYNVRSYAINSQGPAYGNQITFKTTASTVISMATVVTAAVSAITTTEATLNGNVTGDGNATVTERGFVYGTAQNPTTSDTKVAVGNGNGTFTTTLTGLTAGTTYYEKAYAINSQGTAYGNQITFKTNAIIIPTLATLTTAPASGITFSGAILAGGITNNGNATITERGFVYGTAQDPTTSDTKVPVGNGGAAFTTYITGLTAGTSYYVRTYAINSVGTAYGNQITFDTPLSISLASVLTIPPTNITSTSARGGGYIVSDGGAAVTSSGICWSTSENPTTSDSKVSGGAATGQFGGQISGLTDGITYYVRAFAINSAGTSYGNQVSFITSPPVKIDPVSDVDGNTYKAIAIGAQIWMAENLRTTKYNDGTNIPLVEDSVNWRRLITPGYCWYNNDKANKRTYGGLYNWFTIDTGKLCPTGWSVPSDDQWTELTTFLGGENIAGARLKESGTTHWTSPNTGGVDTNGFTALPGGGRGAQSVFGLLGNDGNWWTSTEDAAGTAWFRVMRNNQIAVGRNAGNKRSGFSVRCIKD
ncbi:MAG: fibrobacter succinogenes major paralogous domain-containing protein [Prolixibacteraceae bacterium]